MAFEFDPEKDIINIGKHSYSLSGAPAVFDGPYIEEEDAWFDYEETRFVAIGPITALSDRLFVVVYTWRGANRRLISFRKANDKEIRKYRDSHA